MKKMLFVITVYMTLTGIFSKTAFCRTIVAMDSTAEELLQVLCETRESQDREKVWGKHDSWSAHIEQLRALGVLSSRGFLDQHGQYVGPPLRADDQDVQRWMDRFSVSPTDTEGILKMLSDPSPPIRDLGLTKVSSLDKLPKPIVAKLENIVQSDTDVLMVILTEVFLPDAIEHVDFRSPWRDLAASILQKHGREDVTVDNFQVALLGLAQMNGSVEAGMDKMKIAHDLSMLDGPESIGCAIWREVNANREKYPQYAALFQAWDEAISRGAFSHSINDKNDPNNPVVQHVRARLSAATSPSLVNNKNCKLWLYVAISFCVLCPILYFLRRKLKT